MLLASFRGMNSDGGMNAQAAYDKMVAQFGERAVLDAATKASQLKRGPCGSSDKAVCVSYKWHMDDPPTKPHPQHYAGESDGTIYIATMLLLNPEMHTEKDCHVHKVACDCTKRGGYLRGRASYKDGHRHAAYSTPEIRSVNEEPVRAGDTIRFLRRRELALALNNNTSSECGSLLTGVARFPALKSLKNISPEELRACNMAPSLLEGEVLSFSCRVLNA